MKKQACKNDHFITEENNCSICNDSNFSNEFKGKLIIINKDESDIAKYLEHTKNGEYAIKVR